MAQGVWRVGQFSLTPTSQPNQFIQALPGLGTERSVSQGLSSSRQIRMVGHLHLTNEKTKERGATGHRPDSSQEPPKDKECQMTP